jgi:hypothetical protein
MKCHSTRYRNPLILLLSGLLLFVLNTAAVGGASSRGLLEILRAVRTMELLFEYRFGFDSLEFGLEVLETLAHGSTVAASAWVGNVVPVIFQLFALTAPVAFATTVLLGLLRVGINVARFGKVARKMLLWMGSSVGEAGVVTVVVLVGASHGNSNDGGDDFR